MTSGSPQVFVLILEKRGQFPQPKPDAFAHWLTQPWDISNSELLRRVNLLIQPSEQGSA